MKELIDKTLKEIEDRFGFEYYLETKDDFLSGKLVDGKKLINSFVEFNKDNELKVVKLYDGVVQEINDMNLTEIKNNLSLLADKKGFFYDDAEDELATVYGFLCNDYFAEITESVIFFSGKQDSVVNFAKILKKNTLEFHEPEKISEIGKNIEITRTKKKKLGRNELCHCGSDKKYKKCCLDKDIEETGKPMKVDDLWEDGYFAETLSPGESKKKEKTIHKKHDEDMRFNCKKCNVKISAHNKDWHAGMCDKCFNKEFHVGNENA